MQASLNDALKALIMTRGDLTFRGDYLEPDSYRLALIDDIMNDPLRAIDYTRDRLDLTRFSDLKYDRLLKSEGNRLAPLQPSGSQKPFAGLFTRADTLKLGAELVSLLDRLMTLAYDVNPQNWWRFRQYSQAQRDSLIEGFTLLLEENVDDEFRSVDELDSIAQYEDQWAQKLVALANGCQGRGRIADEFCDLLSSSALTESDASRMIPAAARLHTVNSPYGKIVIGDSTDNVYAGNLFIIIDPGGNDTYNVVLDGVGRQTYIIDLSGDDTYNMPKNRISPYFSGADMIVDFEGDDVYDAGSWTLGAGLLGVGILWDKKGNDKYFGDTFTQGAGCFGMGILRDDGGNDFYHAALYSQGFGFVDGIGILLDSAGNDTYFAGGKYKDILRYNDHYLSLSQGFAYGLRPKMSGGIGLLIDKSGNDFYISDIFGQGASYWYGLGILADGGGNDLYASFQYAQGAATHMTVGILYDVSGDDVYSAKGVSQGCGHDRAAGILVDLDGNDSYSAYDLSQAAGSANGLGILADIRGNDAYIVRSDQNTQGFGQPRHDYGSIGIFLDLGGKDGYAGGPAQDSTWWSDSKWGVGVDR
jgi:hypothetical protein